jgi:tetratricopeptide (TPR) repeat protein
MTRSLGHAERSGQIREQLAAQWLLAHAILLGPTPVPACIQRCRELSVVHGDEHPGVLSDLAIASAMAGRFEESRELNERARTICIERLRVRRPLLFIAHSTAIVEMLAGEGAAAEPHLRAAWDLAFDMEEWDDAAQVAARLSTVLRALGRSQEAATYASRSAQTAPVDAVEAQARSRAAAARVMAETGESRRAERAAREAVGRVPDEMLNLRADLLVELAEVLRTGGQAHASMEAFKDAAKLYERKGNRVSSVRLRTECIPGASAGGM